MKIVDPSYEILTELDPYLCTKMLELIERVGRTCYKSEDKITDVSAKDFIKKLMARGHEAMIEHFNITVKFVCARGFSHELVRHRLASYAQESTRYCNYSQDKFGKEITVVKPAWVLARPEFGNWDAHQIWVEAMNNAEMSYFRLIGAGMPPQDARGVLPIDLKTEVVITANLREWRHIFKLRTAKTAHPSMRQLMRPLLKEFQNRIPVLFEDIKFEEEV